MKLPRLTKKLLNRVRRVFKSGIYKSETSKCRNRLSKFCVGFGIDIGFGGDKIIPRAIGVDLNNPYADTGNNPVQLGFKNTGDFKLDWFHDSTLDFVFSSHLLEDFKDTEVVLTEWVRVLKAGGNLIIYCPNEQLYREHCKKTGQPYNAYHVHDDFGYDYVRKILDKNNNLKYIYGNPFVEDYSFEVVYKKIK